MHHHLRGVPRAVLADASILRSRSFRSVPSTARSAGSSNSHVRRNVAPTSCLLLGVMADERWNAHRPPSDMLRKAMSIVQNVCSWRPGPYSNRCQELLVPCLATRPPRLHDSISEEREFSRAERSIKENSLCRSLRRGRLSGQKAN